MGLDMYLNRKRYVWDRDRKKLQIKGIRINPKSICYIEEEAMYWRKANAIHSWFVDNVQDGNDDCKSYYVSKEKLQELFNLCKRVLADRSLASELLPTQSGFFFGGTEYDEYYFEELKNTKKALNKILSRKDKHFEYYYSSSW